MASFADVSVVIPAYNAERTLAETIRSVLAQSIAPREIIVVDDRSSDATASVAESFAPAVQVVRRAVNGGPGAARNTGIGAAQGKWIGLLDADDLWLPAKLERQLLSDTDPRIGIIACLSDRPGDAAPSELSFEELWERNLLVNSTVLLRRDVWEQVGGFDEARELISLEDYNLWLRVAAAGWRIIVRQEVLAHYRRGVGISSDTQRFLAASLFNLDRLEKILPVASSQVRRRRAETLDRFASSALYRRDMALARELGAKAARMAPSPARLARLGITYLPEPILNAKRNISAVMGVDAPPSLFGQPVTPAMIPLSKPTLLVIVDAEEEFDWRAVPPREGAVTSMSHQVRAQRVFERFGCLPTYAVDYPVAAQPDGYKPLLEFVQSGSCLIGAQLHPWLNPPIEEELSVRNSFPGNLPARLEAQKLRVLTKVIEDNLRVRPTLYRAGRYGLGPNTPRLLKETGYCIDCSVRPFFSGGLNGAPDYRDAYNFPFWLDDARSVLELPVTVGLTGALSRSRRLLNLASHSSMRPLRLGSLLAVSRLIDRFQLSPEGTQLADAKRLTRSMLGEGHRLFIVSYHSPSLQPGNTPYVRTASDLQRFLSWLEGYFEFFLGELGGSVSTPEPIYESAATWSRHANPVHQEGNDNFINAIDSRELRAYNL